MSTPPTSFPSPSEEDLEEALLSCRYGELPEVQSYVLDFGIDSLASARDESGNTCLHMAAGNGHLDVLTYLLPLLPPSLFSTPNPSGSTPLHWASLNGHLPIVKALVLHPLSPGDSLIDIKNNAGRTAVGEAEMMERLEVASWLVGRMLLEDKSAEKKEEEIAGEGSVSKEDEGEEEEVSFKLSLNEDKSDVVFTPIDK
ncbi:ankyrin repeat-containing domain protein [Mrakia frigida]|uniref:ankyrin repeat domain-containing protein n=1 Tax=Mrakia frigida TaxID=29902 RepID=UPI003FCC1D2A